MKKFCFFVFLYAKILILIACYQDNDIYAIIDGSNNPSTEGLELLNKYLNIKDDITIINYEQIDLDGDGSKNEYYIKYYSQDTQMHSIVILSRRDPGILYFTNWYPIEQFNVTFFSRNDNHYLIMDYRGGSGSYYVFSILEYDSSDSMFMPLKILY
jgi:hypothetical protein